MTVFLLSALLLAWILFTFGLCLIGTRSGPAAKLKKRLWNGRIDQLGRPPFSLFLRAYGEKKYIRSFLLVLLCNAPGHIAMLLLGYLKVGLIMLAVQPFLQGAVVGMGDDRTRLWGVATAVFEVTGFAVSCGIGFWGRLDLWWISAVFLILNALVEAGGALLGVQGVPGLRAVERKEYIP